MYSMYSIHVQHAQALHAAADSLVRGDSRKQVTRLLSNAGATNGEEKDGEHA